MIKYNAKTINDWYYGISDLVKVYKGGAVCYYKVSGTPPSPTSQTPCFAVVDDISQYQETEFEDVFNNADGKWYKLNNLNAYEEYGVYGSGRTITTYEGKLTIDEDTQPSRLPSGYTEVEYIRQNSSYNAYIDTGVIPYGSVGNSFEVSATMKAYYKNTTCDTFLSCEYTNSPYFGFGYRFVCAGGSNYQIFGSDGNTATTVTNNSDGTFTYVCSRSNVTTTYNMPISLFCSYSDSSYTTPYRFSDIEVHSMSITLNNEIVRNFVPAKRDSDNKYGLYDLVTDTFYVSPNGNNFVGGSEVNPPKTCEFIYSGDSWVNLGEVSGSTASLPNKSFVLNYNAKDYDGTTHSIQYTSGQSKAVNAIQNYGTNTIVDHSSDGYISVTANTRLTISGGTTPMYRTNTETGCTMTIVSKARTTANYSILTCRNDSGNNMNWMWRYPSNGIFLHGSTSYNKLTYYTTTSASPITASVRVSWNGSVQQQINDWTNNGSYSGAFRYGDYQNVNNNGSLFCDYLANNDEFWKGDFYWVYMSQEVLSDEEIQQVIAFNEGGGGTPVYPMYYTEMQDPPNNLSFSSMTEAEEYECPWVGMNATIDGDKYIFSGDSTSGYEWVQELPYTELQWIEMPKTSPYCAVQLVDTYSACTHLYYEFTVMFNSLSDTRIIGFNGSNSYLIGYNGSTIYLNINKSRKFTIGNFATNTVYHFGLGYKNGSNVFENLGTSSTYSSYNGDLPKTEKPYFGAIKLNGTIYVNGESERIYSVKVYDNGVLVGDYIPVKRNSDDFVTLYDKITEQYCDTVGGGEMVAS